LAATISALIFFLAAGKTAQVNLHKKEISNMHTPKQPNCKRGARSCKKESGEKN